MQIDGLLLPYDLHVVQLEERNRKNKQGIAISHSLLGCNTNNTRAQRI
jgi:hypothetical protein